MFTTIARIFQLPDLKKKIMFTLLLLLVYRIGGFIPVPGINGEVALAYFRQAAGGEQNLFQLVDIFSGGAFSSMTSFALGVVPYISASIILQLLVALIPSLQREMRENPEMGRRKINRWTRYGTLALSFIQATLFAKYALQINMSNPGIISPELLDVQAFWCIMALLHDCDYYHDYRYPILDVDWRANYRTWIGNGMSLIITVGILSSLPTTLGVILQQLNLDSPEAGQLSLFSMMVLFALFVIVMRLPYISFKASAGSRCSMLGVSLVIAKCSLWDPPIFP